MRLLTTLSEDACREVVVQFLNSFFSTLSNNESEENKQLWELILKEMHSNFPPQNSFPVSPFYTLDIVRKQVALGSLFLRISARLGLEWKKEIYGIVNEKKISSMKLTIADLLQIQPRIHSIQVLPVFHMLRLIQTSEAMENYYERLLSIHPVGSDLSSAILIQTLAEQHIYKGHYNLALPLYLRLQQMIEKAREPDHPDVATIYYFLGKVYMLEGNYKLSEEFLNKSLTIREKIQNKIYVAIVLESLAQLNKLLGKYDEVETLAKKALVLYKEVLGQYHPDNDLEMGKISTL